MRNRAQNSPRKSRDVSRGATGKFFLRRSARRGKIVRTAQPVGNCAKKRREMPSESIVRDSCRSARCEKTQLFSRSDLFSAEKYAAAIPGFKSGCGIYANCRRISRIDRQYQPVRACFTGKPLGMSHHFNPLAVAARFGNQAHVNQFPLGRGPEMGSGEWGMGNDAEPECSVSSRQPISAFSWRTMNQREGSNSPVAR